MESLRKLGFDLAVLLRPVFRWFLPGSHHTPRTATPLCSRWSVFTHQAPLRGSCVLVVRMQPNCTQIMFSNFQSIWRVFPCLNNGWSSDNLGSVFPSRVANISVLVALCWQWFYQRQGHMILYLTRVLSSCKQFLPPGCWACPQRSGSPLFSHCWHWNQNVSSKLTWMSSWSFPTFRNERSFGFALFSCFGHGFLLCSSVQVACTACYTRLNSSVRDDKYFGGISSPSLPSVCPHERAIPTHTDTHSHREPSTASSGWWAGLSREKRALETQTWPRVGVPWFFRPWNTIAAAKIEMKVAKRTH